MFSPSSGVFRSTKIITYGKMKIFSRGIFSLSMNVKISTHFLSVLISCVLYSPTFSVFRYCFKEVNSSNTSLLLIFKSFLISITFANDFLQPPKKILNFSQRIINNRFPTKCVLLFKTLIFQFFFVPDLRQRF